MNIETFFSAASALNSILSTDEKKSSLTISIESNLKCISVSNIGNADAYNITIEVVNSNLQNPFPQKPFSLSPGETKSQALFVMDGTDSHVQFDISWTDETEGDLFKSFLFDI